MKFYKLIGDKFNKARLGRTEILMVVHFYGVYTGKHD